MPPNQAMPKAHIRAPTDQQEAAEILAASRYSRSEKWTKARVYREAVNQYLARQDDLPEEARDLLDDDLLANAGEGSEYEVEAATDGGEA